MKNALELNHLIKQFAKPGAPAFKAVNDITLHIPQGQIFGFLGPNGAGKTTTIKMICGLIRPTSGQISVNGYDVKTQHPDAMSSIGAVLEGTRNIYWQLSAWDNLMYFGRLKGVVGVQLPQRAEQLLRELKLWERKDDSVGGFSRGMQQKVAIACALIADPPIILLDEPTLGLDVHAAQTVKELVDDLARRQHKTVILTTHQLDIAEQLCDRIAIIRAGRIITDKPIDDLLDLFREARFEVHFEGSLTDKVDLFDGYEYYEDDEMTIVTLPSDAKEHVYRIMQLVKEHNLPLFSIQKKHQTLEHIFVRLLEEQSA